mmetsp:Transcript_8079/g.19317  ORF Transcript_8079/g.19317 Transcript_8079/m.19317 type:complete len:392 (+) Transcript_8079:1078-2253(+)
MGAARLSRLRKCGCAELRSAIASWHDREWETPRACGHSTTIRPLAEPRPSCSTRQPESSDPARRAVAASSNLSLFSSMYRSAALMHFSCSTGSIESSSMLFASSTGLKRKYERPGMIGHSVERHSAVRSMLHAFSIRTLPVSRYDDMPLGRFAMGTAPAPRLTTHSIGVSGHSALASCTVSAPSHGVERCLSAPRLHRNTRLALAPSARPPWLRPQVPRIGNGEQGEGESRYSDRHQRRVVRRHRAVLPPVFADSEVIQVIRRRGGCSDRLPDLVLRGAVVPPHRLPPPHPVCWVLVVPEDEWDGGRDAHQCGHDKHLGPTKRNRIDEPVAWRSDLFHVTVLLKQGFEGARVVLAAVHGDPHALGAALVHRVEGLAPRQLVLWQASLLVRP